MKSPHFQSESRSHLGMVEVARKIAFLFIASMVSICTSFGQVPRTISFQGVLTDNTGQLVSDGPYSLTFKFYRTATGGTEFWTETQTSVDVSNGIFNVVLGSINTLEPNKFDEQYWCGVSVNATAEMTPRTLLTSAPYSLNARAVYGTTNVFPETGEVGIGTRTPQNELEVIGKTKTDAFQMPTGAADGYVLTSDPGGNGSWQQLNAQDGDWYVDTRPASNDMYSMPTGLVGIGYPNYVTTPVLAAKLDVVDVGAAGITLAVPTGKFTKFDIVGDAITAVIIDVNNASNAVSATTFGVGDAGSFWNFGTAGGAIDAVIVNAVNASNAVSATTAGIGDAGNFSNTRGAGGGNAVRANITAAGNASDAINATTSGTGMAVNATAVSGIAVNAKNNSATKPAGYFQNIGADVSLYAGHSDGTALSAFNNSVVSPTCLFKNNLAGLGQAGQTVFTTAIDGTALWAENNSALGLPAGLFYANNKGSALVAISTKDEPTVKIENKGSGMAVDAQNQSSESTGNYYNAGNGAGLSGISNLGIGVFGGSLSSLEAEAGVRAYGNGVQAPGQPQAAALAIRNGAITVQDTGIRPAGQVAVLPNWLQIISANTDCPGCVHNHVTGWFSDLTILNPLIKPESFLYLTVVGTGQSFFAQVNWTDAGSAGVRVTTLGDAPPPPNKLLLNYLIITPVVE